MARDTRASVPVAPCSLGMCLPGVAIQLSREPGTWYLITGVINKTLYYLRWMGLPPTDPAWSKAVNQKDLFTADEMARVLCVAVPIRA